jgi:hypothetical protein
MSRIPLEKERFPANSGHAAEEPPQRGDEIGDREENEILSTAHDRTTTDGEGKQAREPLSNPTPIGHVIELAWGGK